MIDTRIVSGQITRRRGERSPLPIEAGVGPVGGQPVHARLINISANGFMAETETRYEPGTHVWLMLPGRDRADAVVVWADGTRIGAEFAEEIDPLAVFHAVGKRAPSPSAAPPSE